jgi:hypothetical protein
VQKKLTLLSLLPTNATTIDICGHRHPSQNTVHEPQMSMDFSLALTHKNPYTRGAKTISKFKDIYFALKQQGTLSKSTSTHIC